MCYNTTDQHNDTLKDIAGFLETLKMVEKRSLTLLLEIVLPSAKNTKGEIVTLGKLHLKSRIGIDFENCMQTGSVTLRA